MSLPSLKKYQYDAAYKPNQLITGSGQIAIITGWTIKKAIAQNLESQDFAVIGNLYSATRGISPLFRNLCLNPHVHHLITINATKEDKNSGSCRCLNDFFENGFRHGVSDSGREVWVIESDIVGYIDIEIPESKLNELRTSVQCHVAKSIDEAIKLVHQCNTHLYALEDWGIPEKFPMLEIKPTVLPGVRYGHRIEGKTVAETWVKILHRIKTTGTIRPTGYDGNWQELINLTAIVTDEPENFFFPEPNFLPIDRDYLKTYIPQILDDAPCQVGVKYSYGQRLRSWFQRDQVEQVINKLVNEIDAASAVMSLWDVKDHETGGSPCLNHIWVRVVDMELSLTAVFRSNDMFSAWPANAMGLRALQIHIKNEIEKRSDYKLVSGPLITLSQSAHIYDDTWENVDRLIQMQYKKICKNREFDDPCGNFVIEIDSNEILINQTTPGSGEFVQSYRGKNPLGLIRQICEQTPAIKPDHIGYLGIELQKAFAAIKNNSTYTQDI